MSLPASTREDVMFPLPSLSPICIKISRRSILQQAMRQLDLPIREIKVHQMGPDGILASVCIDVPPNSYHSTIESKEFYGEYALTTDEAIESAHQSALVSLQERNIIYVDDANYSQLQIYQRGLLEAKSWASAFEACTITLQEKLSALGVSTSTGTTISSVAAPKNSYVIPIDDTLPSITDQLLTRKAIRNTSTARRVLFAAKGSIANDHQD